MVDINPSIRGTVTISNNTNFIIMCSDFTCLSTVTNVNSLTKTSKILTSSSNLSISKGESGIITVKLMYPQYLSNINVNMVAYDGNVKAYGKILEVLQ